MPSKKLHDNDNDKIDVDVESIGLITKMKPISIMISDSNGGSSKKLSRYWGLALVIGGFVLSMACIDYINLPLHLNNSMDNYKSKITVADEEDLEVSPGDDGGGIRYNFNDTIDQGDEVATAVTEDTEDSSSESSMLSLSLLNQDKANTTNNNEATLRDHYTSPAAIVKSSSLSTTHPDHHPIEGKPGYKKHPRQLSDRYSPRAQFIDNNEKIKMIEQWGQWNFTDAEPMVSQRLTNRQMEQLYYQYPYGDIPLSAFPMGAWQTDSTFLSSFVPESIALIDRALEAVLAEYGRSKFDRPSDSFEERSKLFLLTFHGSLSYQGLVKRILHAIMTEDTFTMVTGGHSAAAGHGNHFQYVSYLFRIDLSIAFPHAISTLWPSRLF
jgi:hypothetical protein